jgi:hypothetical protein
VLIGVSSSLIAAIITFVITWLYRSAKIGGLKKFLVFPPNGDQLNSKFYEYFRKQIGRAKTEIIVTGEGFECRSAQGIAEAESYHTSMRSALQKNIDVTRIQTARPFHPPWANKLKECIRDFPDKFHLYIVDNQHFQDVASVCVIDAGTKDNVVEFMLSAENDIADKSVRIASTALFIHGQQDLANAMKMNILTIKKSKITKKCKTEADIDQFLNP